FLPPPPQGAEAGASQTPFLGLQWSAQETRHEGSASIGWWRTESDLIANTRNGEPLPVDRIKVFKSRSFEGPGQDLVRLEDDTPLIARLLPDTLNRSSGAAYVWGTLPRTDHSTLATEGVVFFVMTHRALAGGVNAVSTAQFRDPGSSLINQPNISLEILSSNEGDAPLSPNFTSGAYETRRGNDNPKLIALNRPATEDSTRLVSDEALESILEGVDYRLIADELGSDSALAAEVWRLFLGLMAFALLIEAALSLPPRLASRDPAISLAPPDSAN
ncbi:MAG: hypothetical protein AAGA96_11935, partial [Verrucomicrobiota bacterium]